MKNMKIRKSSSIGFLVLFLSITLLFASSIVTATGQMSDHGVLWSTNHETGDMSEWIGDELGGIYNTNTGVVTVEEEAAYSGKYGMKMEVWDIDKEQQACRVHRHPQLKDGYYSAWMKFPVVPVMKKGDWSIIFQFKETSPKGESDPTWYLTINQDSKGHYLRLREWGRSWPAEPENGYPRIQDNEWFHVEVYNHIGYGDGKLTVWVNGVKYWDLEGINTKRFPDSSDHVRSWGVTLYGQKWKQSNVVCYVDNAAVSSKRIGPGYFDSLEQDNNVILKESFDVPGKDINNLKWNIAGDEGVASIEEMDGDMNLKFEDPSKSSAMQAMGHFRPVNGKMTVDVSFMQPEYVAWTALLLKNNTTNAAEIYTKDNGDIVYRDNNGTDQLVGTFTENTWNKLKLDIDVKNNQCDVYLNDELKLEKQNLRNAVENINNMVLKTGGGGMGTAYFDDVVVTMQPERRTILGQFFNDQEEYKSPEKWFIFGNAGKATVRKLDDGNGTLEIADYRITGNVEAVKNIAPVSGKFTLEYSFMQSVFSNWFGVILMDEEETATEIYIQENGFIELTYRDDNGRDHCISKIKSDYWYTVKLEADTAAKKCDVYLNGKLMLKDMPFSNPVSSIDKIMIKSGYAGIGQVNVDNILISQD